MEIRNSIERVYRKKSSSKTFNQKVRLSGFVSFFVVGVCKSDGCIIRVNLVLARARLAAGVMPKK